MARARPADALPAALVVLAKHPVPGRVKTRLAAAIGPSSACRVYAACVRDLRARLRSWHGPVWWAFTPARAPFARMVGRHCFAQRGSDLGARIDHALTTVARRTGRPVIALGADAPHVSLREIARADRVLARGRDVVLGPADDGGYYLVGVRAPTPALFVDVPWSTPAVMRATRARCRRLGLSFAEVAAGFDVDGGADLARLAAIVRRRPDEFVHLRAVLETLTRRAEWPRPVASPSWDCGRR